MTVIKQTSIASSRHLENVGRYLDDGRALARWSQNIIDERNYLGEMARTREACGHHVPSRAGSANVLAYMHTIAFLPEECSCNGGKMTPELCMEFAREWISTRYADYEAVVVLHRERCAADQSERFAAHALINRSNLETGLRLAEGRGQAAKVERANAMRDMDGRWGLRRLERGVRNSAVHAMQPTRPRGRCAAGGCVRRRTPSGSAWGGR